LGTTPSSRGAEKGEVVRIYSITVTPGQFKHLEKVRTTDEEEWYERLADVTEHDPVWLRQALCSSCMESVLVSALRGAVCRPRLKRRAQRVSRNVVMFVRSSRKDSGKLSWAEM
jgi:hypothetical protein